MMPPPIPISVEKKPITVPAIDRQGFPGSSSPSRQLSRLKRRRMPKTSANTVKISRRPSLEMYAATIEASTAPAATEGA